MSPKAQQVLRPPLSQLVAIRGNTMAKYGEDLDVHCGMPFPKGIKTKPGETVVFAWIVYKSRKHRDQVNAKVMKDPRLNKMPKKMPFDVKRMIYGGFDIVVDP
jgi:uncharacterized protein YbaA (DUF1428 family)